jgi:PKD repeat protein
MKKSILAFSSFLIFLLVYSACKPVSFVNEPIAVLSASAGHVETGEAVSFSAEGSTDPDGLNLNPVINFGDGSYASVWNTTHSYQAPGAYRAFLTVTNEKGVSDSTSKIISVGDFPEGSGLLNELAFSPSHYNPRIIEQRAAPDNGGQVFGYFTAPFDCSPDTIIINGVGASVNPDVSWAEVIQKSLKKGKPGILRFFSPSADFNAGKIVSIEIKQGSETIWSISAALPEPSLTPSYITSNIAGDCMLVHVRNDSVRTLTVTGISIDGLDISDFAVISNPDIAPGQASIISIPRHDGVPFGKWMVFTVHGLDGLKALNVSRSLRLFKPVFPVGNWNSSIFRDMAMLDKQLSLGINMFIYYPSPDDPPEFVIPLAEEKDFYLFTHMNNLNDYQKAFVKDYGNNPRVLLNAVSGEGDLSGDPAVALEEVRVNREIWGEKPLWVYNACSYSFPAWGGLADYGGMDHYCVMAPKCNEFNLPPFSWDRIEFSGEYSHLIKTAAEPRPTWNWTQSMFNTMDLRCTSPDEIRAQWHQVLGNGSRGILWFIFNKEWAEKCPGCETEEMKILADELKPIQKIMLEGEVAGKGVIADTNRLRIDVNAVVAPDGIAIFVTNLNYLIRLLPRFYWFPQNNVLIDVTPPAGFEPAQFLMLDGDQKRPLESYKVAGGHWRFKIDKLDVAQTILVIPEP